LRNIWRVHEVSSLPPQSPPSMCIYKVLYPSNVFGPKSCATMSLNSFCQYYTETLLTRSLWCKVSNGHSRGLTLVLALAVHAFGKSAQNGLAKGGESGESAQNGLANDGESGESRKYVSMQVLTKVHMIRYIVLCTENIFYVYQTV
jgi:hypothetical protein